MSFEDKYLKYKKKYLEFKNIKLTQNGGNICKYTKTQSNYINNRKKNY